jgi:hypothetical protein
MLTIPVHDHLLQGYGDKFTGNIYTGYLNLTNATRKLHYLFI